MPPEERYAERQVVRISGLSAALGVGFVVLALLAQRVFVAAHRPLSWAAAAVVVAALIDPLVGVLGRRIPRVLAVLLALLVLSGAIFGVAYRAFDDLSAGLDRLGEAAEDAVDRVERRDDNIGELAADVQASRRVDDLVAALDERATGGEDVLASTAGTAPTYLIGAVFTVFFLSYGPRLAGSALVQVGGEERRRRVTHVVLHAVGRARRAVLLTVGEALVAGVGVGVAATLLDLPAPSTLGLAAGLMALLPHVGLLLGSLPFLLLVLGLRSDPATIVATVVIAVCQLADSMLVRPRVAQRSVHVGLLVPWVVTLVGYATYGVGGVAYGLAFAVFAVAVVDEMQVASAPDHTGRPTADVADPTGGDLAPATER